MGTRDGIKVRLGVGRKEQIHVGLMQRSDCSDVLPIAIIGIGDHLLFLGKHRRNDVLPKVVIAIFVFGIGKQGRAKRMITEDINSHRCEVGLWNLGFFLEGRDVAIIVGFKNSKAAGFLDGDGHDCNRAVRLLLFRQSKHRVIGAAINVVTR